MDNYYLYLPVREKEDATGLTLLNTGCTRIEKNSRYPPISHPSHHNFNWTSGRVLQEYQLIYITRGGGLFESESCREEITEGTVILLHPGERHRYSPHSHSGWDETWVGFRGELIDKIIRENAFGPEKAVFRVGHNETILNLFRDIHRFSRGESPGCQPVVAGAIIYLLGLIHADNGREIADRTKALVTRACTLFRERACENISPGQVAEELAVSYSLFRKAFTKYTGITPGQYLIQCRIQKAKELLADPNKLIKEVSFELNMESTAHFCKLFKEKVGVTPATYRRQRMKLE
jgi:AraC-like DNA-binding protein